MTSLGLDLMLVERRFNPLYWGVLIVTRYQMPWMQGPVIGFQSSLLRCSDCDWIPNDRRKNGPRFNPLYWGVLIVTAENGSPGQSCPIEVSILFIEVFWLWRRSLNLLILLVPYVIFRTPPQNWNFLGDIALVQKWPNRRFPLCDVGLHVSEHPRGFCRSSRCSENQFLIGNLQRLRKPFRSKSRYFHYKHAILFCQYREPCECKNSSQNQLITFQKISPYLMNLFDIEK